jgi:hypothetical protein
VQGAVRSVLIVVGLVLAQDPPQMGLGDVHLLRYAKLLGTLIGGG